MPAKIALDSLLAVAKRSNLLTAEQLKSHRDAFAQHGGDASDARRFAEFLVEQRAVTRWQADKLLQGKHKGFFLGKYKLLSLLGKGGMSSVYLAEHVLMRRRCAIKVLPTKRVHDTSYLGRFHREAQAVAALDDPNIVRAYDVDHEVDGDMEIHFLVMEYVDGKSLLTLVQDDGPRTPLEAADFIRQAALGLSHAHQAGLVHRDIKPGNLLVDKSGTVKLLDLGLARFFAGSEDIALTIEHDEKVLGTADYLAPEQAVDSHLVDARADIYSLGCTMYFLLTGHPPFTKGTLTQRLLAHQTKEPPGVETERSDVPQSLLDILKRMMAKQPDDRYPDCDGLAAELANWLQAHGGADRVAGSDKGSDKDGHQAAADTDIGTETETGTSSSPSQPAAPAAGDAGHEAEPELGAFLAHLESEEESGTKQPEPSRTPAQPARRGKTRSSGSSAVRGREKTREKQATKGSEEETVVQTRPAQEPQAVELLDVPPTAVSQSSPTDAPEPGESASIGGAGAVIVDTTPVSPSRRSRKRGNNAALIGVAIAGGTILVAVIAYVVSQNSSGTGETPAPPVEQFQGADAGPDEGGAETPEDLGPQIRVGSDGDFDTISAAIAYVETQSDRFDSDNPCTILVEGGTEFDERLVIHGDFVGGFPEGSRIASDGAPVVLRPRSGEGPVIDIAETTNVTIEGFLVDAGGGEVAIRLSDYLNDTHLQNLVIENFTRAAIHSVEGIALPGSLVRFTDLKIRSRQSEAVGIQLDDMRHAQITRCRFLGPIDVGVVIDTTARSGYVTIRESIFHDLKTGVLFRGGVADLQSFQFINNTFHRVQRGVVLYEMPQAGSSGFEFRNNLFSEITGAETVVERRFNADGAAEMLLPENSVNNWSERSADDAGDGELDIFATDGRRGIDAVDFVSTDPDSDDFLKPTDPALRNVGAVRPD